MYSYIDFLKKDVEMLELVDKKHHSVVAVVYGNVATDIRD